MDSKDSTASKGRTLYFDCTSGVSSDMLLGALVDVGADIGQVKEALVGLQLPAFDLKAERIVKNGFAGIQATVSMHGADGHAAHAPGAPHAHDHSHASGAPHDAAHTHDHAHSHAHSHDPHASYRAIRARIEASGMDEAARQRALRIYRVIAEAEAAVHGTAVEDVAFHEVGRTEQIVTICAICAAVGQIGVSRILTSAVHDGTGQIQTAHGWIPVPVPAVVEILKKSAIPIVIEADVATEMTTPSGLAVLEGLGAVFSPKLTLLPERSGYGFGRRDTGRFGAVRALIGR
ncbi:MAG: LarC family nickel insertion protein [Clostridiales Family XIII bacterium]|jgi:uncharacterized protein (DUF111 family)|nr:LarC family nickel insertion protein [Clostridiales Family XIII bacterium]